MAYTIKEILYTLQGEGANSGRPAVFCRFTGCNLWSGHEVDRAYAVCKFCDTDFLGTNGLNGGNFKEASVLAETVNQTWNTHVKTKQNKFIVCTGGEPLLQLDTNLIDAFHKFGFEVAIETNGTKPAPPNIWTVSSEQKANASEPRILHKLASIAWSSIIFWTFLK